MGAASLVFVGVLVSQREVGPNARLPGSQDVELTFRVESVLKGSAGRTVVLRTDTTTCGFGRAEPGLRYGMFAGGASLQTSAVSGNQQLTAPAEVTSFVAEVKHALKGTPTSVRP